MKGSVVISGGIGTNMALVMLSGSIDGSISSRIFDDINTYHKQHQSILKYLFDFGDLTELDSKGISDLIGFHHNITRKGGMVVIARPDPEIAELLETIGVDRTIEIFPSLTEAQVILSEAVAEE